MDVSFDGSRNLRLQPPCICGDIMRWEGDAKEWYCEECDLILEPGWENTLKVDDDGDEITAYQDATVICDDEPFNVEVSWSLTNFMIQVNTLTKMTHKMLEKAIGLTKSNSRYWGSLEDD